MDNQNLRFLTIVTTAIIIVMIGWLFPLLSGTTGKIAGTVTDTMTGEPLPGVSITVVGTSLRTQSDLDGRYTILSVSPGCYNIRISCPGYRNITLTGITINIDQTAWVNSGLDTQTTEKEFLESYRTSNILTISGNDVKQLPVNSLISVLGLQAGIEGGWDSRFKDPPSPYSIQNDVRGKVSVQGDFRIRGGEGDNILFLVDGVTMRDPRNNEPLTTLPLSAINKITVMRGGFDAEYGQARSGIVHVITKEGSKDGYLGNIQVRYSPPARKYWKGPGILDVQEPYSFALRPFFDPDVCWTGTANGGWDIYTQRKYPSFLGWNRLSKALSNDDDPANDLTPGQAQRVFCYEIRKRLSNNRPDYDIDGGFGGPVPFVSETLGDLRFFTSYRTHTEALLIPLTKPEYRDYDWMMQLNSDITPSMKLRIVGFVGKQYTIRNNGDATGIYFYPRSPNEIASVVQTNQGLSDLFPLFSDFNFCLADIGRRSVAATLTHILSPSSFYEISVGHFRRDYNIRPTELRDTSQHYEIVPGYFEDSNPFGYWPEESNGLIVTNGRHAADTRDFTVVSSTTLKADFSSQINFQNLVKAGFEFVYNDLDFDYGMIMPWTFGRSYENRVQLRGFPLAGALYVQDKYDIGRLVMSAGVRLDYSNTNIDWWDVDPFDPLFFSARYETDSLFVKQTSESQWLISPRVSLAWAFTDNSTIFFKYGHFRQIPQYESLFRVQRSGSGVMSGFGDPNLPQAKTISCELGFDQSFFNDFLFQINSYYSNSTQQQDYTYYFSDIGGFAYRKITANSYERIRGIELTLRKTAGPWVSGFVNYTYQVNVMGHTGNSRYYNDPSSQRIWGSQNLDAVEDRPIPRPYARADVAITTPVDFGPSIAGYPILGNLGLNIVLDWQAGYRATWNTKFPAVAYNVQSVDFFNTALRLNKIVDFGMFRVQFFMDINNVFNTLRLWDTNDLNYMMSLHLPKSESYNNIPGNDKVGNYREPGIDWQPMVSMPRIEGQSAPNDYRAIYYESSTEKYWRVVNKPDPLNPQKTIRVWDPVPQSEIDEIEKNKAYIDMPNASTFWFLNPRIFYFGMTISFKFGE